MRWLLIVVVLLFVALPVDAQYAIVGLAAPLWTTGAGRTVLLGLAAGMAGAMLVYGAIWNRAMHALYIEDLKKAEETYQRRRK